MNRRPALFGLPLFCTLLTLAPLSHAALPQEKWSAPVSLTDSHRNGIQFFWHRGKEGEVVFALHNRYKRDALVRFRLDIKQTDGTTRPVLATQLVKAGASTVSEAKPEAGVEILGGQILRLQLLDANGDTQEVFPHRSLLAASLPSDRSASRSKRIEARREKHLATEKTFLAKRNKEIEERETESRKALDTLRQSLANLQENGSVVEELNRRTKEADNAYDRRKAEINALYAEIAETDDIQTAQNYVKRAMLSSALEERTVRVLEACRDLLKQQIEKLTAGKAEAELVLIAVQDSLKSVNESLVEDRKRLDEENAELKRAEAQAERAPNGETSRETAENDLGPAAEPNGKMIEAAATTTKTAPTEATGTTLPTFDFEPTTEAPKPTPAVSAPAPAGKTAPKMPVAKSPVLPAGTLAPNKEPAPLTGDAAGMRNAGLLPVDARPSGIVTEKEMAELMKRVEGYLDTPQERAFSMSRPAAPVTRIQALTALVKIVFTDEEIKGNVYNAPESLPADIAQVPAWGKGAAYTAIAQDWWRGNRALNPQGAATWDYIGVLLSRMPLAKGALTTKSRLDPTLKPDADAYTGLVLDAKEFPIERSLSPRILDTEGRVLYPDKLSLPTDKFVQEQGLASYSTGEANSRRVGGKALTIKVLRTSGSDLIVSAEDAEHILKANETGKFLWRWAVCVLVKPAQ